VRDAEGVAHRAGAKRSPQQPDPSARWAGLVLLDGIPWIKIGVQLKTARGTPDFSSDPVFL